MVVEGKIFNDIVVLRKEPIIDNRGSFERVFCVEELREMGLEFDCVQQNISRNIKCGTIRGMHFQSYPHGENKLIQCLKGRVYDVIVDLERNSPNYGKWTSIELSEENGRILYVPYKYAHGFQTLEDDTVMLYHMDNYYCAEAASGINCFSKELAIDWPISTGYTISKKDMNLDEFALGGKN